VILTKTGAIPDAALAEFRHDEIYHAI